MIEGKKRRLEELMIINKRNNLKKKFAEKMPIVGFVDVERTIEIYKKVYEKTKKVFNVIEINKEIEEAKKYISLLQIKLKKMDNKIMILSHTKEDELGAIKIYLYDFLIDINTVLLEIIDYDDGMKDLIFTDESLSLGICIERYEYYDKFIFWGID